MSVDFTKLLNDLGLSPTETRVYMASLKLGPTSVQEIAKVAKLSRTAAYDVIAQLQERGLMSTFERGKKKFFSAEEPERAVAYFKGRMHELEEKIETFTRSLGEIKMLSGGERPTVRFFEGREALFALFSDFGSLHPKELFELSNVDVVYTKLDPKLLMEARKVLDHSNTKIKMLHRGELRNPRSDAEYCRLLPEFGNFEGDFWIYENHIAFVQFIGKMMVVIIESQPFADMAKVLFKAAWSLCSAQSFRKQS
jgi:predicted transcriptional regulator